ncbi:RCC1 domain-containing protein [Elizabethkingia bruuniana]|uniref:RCC1 domain-containing protein n=1 Tax=Elizabethkingia bruuniana TaxID=1756149 RepID=UPI00241FD519|nr:RCC1 domain-containing protein [Elizabethkingia bruuniana]
MQEFNGFIHIDYICYVKSITTGENHSLILTEFGEAYSTGYNNHYQLGLGDKKRGVLFERVENKEFF